MSIVLNVLLSGLPYVPTVLAVYLVFRIRPDYDLTLGGSFVTGAAVTGVLLVRHDPVVAAEAAGVFTGMVLGVVTAVLHIGLRAPIMLLGLFMSFGLYSVDISIMNGPVASLVNVPTVFGGYARLTGTQRDLLSAAIMAAIDLAVLSLAAFLLASERGLALRLTGRNTVLARSVGISENRMCVVNLACANGLAAFSGGLVGQSQGFVVVDSGSGVLLAGLGAVLLGEALLHQWRRGGMPARMLHVCLGTLGYWAIVVAALYLGLAATNLQAVTALIFIVTLAVSRLIGRRAAGPAVDDADAGAGLAREGSSPAAGRVDERPGGWRPARGPAIMPGEVVLSDLVVAYQDGTARQVAVRDFSLTIPQGQRVCLVGHNGAGKSSVLRAIAGLVPVPPGVITFRGQDLTLMAQRRRARMVGLVSDRADDSTEPAMTVAEHFSLALSRGARSMRPALSPERRNEMRILARQAGLGLEHRLDEPVGWLSAGQRQAVALLMACATCPALLLLDEYAANLDPWTARRLHAATVRLAGQAHATVIEVSHAVREALATNDRLVVMRRGQVVADVDPRQGQVGERELEILIGTADGGMAAAAPADRAEPG